MKYQRLFDEAWAIKHHVDHDEKTLNGLNRACIEDISARLAESVRDAIQNALLEDDDLPTWGNILYLIQDSAVYERIVNTSYVEWAELEVFNSADRVQKVYSDLLDKEISWKAYEKFYNKDISQLGLDEKTFACLRRYGLDHSERLLFCDKQMLQEIPGFKDEMLEDILAKVENYIE